MIVATFPGSGLVCAADGVPGSRTIAGTAVPWNTPGRVSSGETVVFHPGSLDASARPVALRDHDRGRPIGVVADARDSGAGLDATVRVSATRDGDDALVLANDGALPMFSVGAEPIDYRYDADGTLHVHAAEWQELSLLTFGAYSGARVSTVTATTPGGSVDPATLTDTPDDPTVDPDAVPDDDDDDTEPNEDIEPDVQTRLPGLVPVTAGRVTATRTRPARHPYAGVGIRELAGFIAAGAQSGDPRVMRQLNAIMTSPGARAPSLQAALDDVTMVGTGNVGGAYRPTYQAELIDIVSHGAPLVELLRQGDLQRGDYPNVTFNQWTATPQVALQTAEKTEINSAPVSIGPTSVPVQTWATGNDLSQQLLDFGSPSFVEDYIRAAGVDYAEVIQLYAATALWTVATNVPTVVGDDIVTVVGKLIGALNPAAVPAGGMFLGVSWDAWAGAIGMKSDDGPAFWSGTVSFGSILPTANMGGLTVVYVPGLPAKSYLLGLRNAATWYDLPGTPFSLRAINVGLLGLDVAVYGYGACGIQYPAALVKTTVPDV
jgi:HK97 family phage prohead protease